MPRKEILDRIQKYVDPFRITKGKVFRLKDFDPADTRGLKLDKGEAADLLQRGTAWLAEEQDILYAQKHWSLLLVFQAMDGVTSDTCPSADVSASSTVRTTRKSLVVRVHPEILKGQKLPPTLVSKGIWDERLADIAHFEDYVSRQGTKILKGAEQALYGPP